MGWLLIILRGEILDILSIQIGNSLLLVGFALEALAMTNSGRLFQNSEKVFKIIAGICVAAFWIAGTAPPNIRVFVISLGVSIIYLTCVWYLLSDPKDSQLRHSIGILYAILCIPMILRAGSSILDPSFEFTLYSQNLIQTLASFSQFLYTFVTGIAFILLLKEHDDNQLRESNENQKKLIDALQESESFNRGLIENLPDYIAVYGENGNILYVNPALSAALGYQPEEMINRPIISFFPDEFHDDLKNNIIKRFEGTEIPIYESILLTRENTRCSVIMKGTMIQYQNSQAVLLLLVDITQRKLTEEALKENELKFISIFEETPNPILIISSACEVVEVNRGFEQTFTYSNEEISGRHIESLNIGLKKEHLNTILEKAEHIGDVLHFQITLTKQNDEPFTADIAVSRIDISSKLCYLIEIHDIDEIHRANKAVTEANRKLNLLSSITRHDIGNELQIIFGYLELAKENAVIQQVKEFIDTAFVSARHIERQLAFTRDYEDIGVKTPVWQNVETVISQVNKNFIISPIQLHIDIHGLEIYSDPLLEKVFYNLIDNAKRYGENITDIWFSGKELEDSYLIVCEDNGVGIPDEYKKKIFNREYYKHTGFGLNLSREILSITGISIRECGTAGKGARFEIEVPKGAYRIHDNQEISG